MSPLGLTRRHVGAQFGLELGAVGMVLVRVEVADDLATEAYLRMLSVQLVPVGRQPLGQWRVGTRQ